MIGQIKYPIINSRYFKHAYYFSSVYALKLVTYNGVILFVSIACFLTSTQVYSYCKESDGHACMVKAFELVLVSMKMMKMYCTYFDFKICI